MKRKINVQLITIAVMSILATLVLTSAAFYKLFCGQVFSDLKVYSILLEEDGYAENLRDKSLDEELRVTIIAKDGSVLLDNRADFAAMENQGDRPEVKKAWERGEGKAVRKSETCKTAFFYFAKETEEGNVIRVAKDTKNLFGVLGNAIPLVLFLAALLLGSCLAMAHFLAESLIRPVRMMAENVDKMDEVEFYEELQPFIFTIRQQHEDIMKSAKMRQDFTANVTHELKTPLTAISGYSELIETGMASDADVIRFAKGIHKNSNRLLTLINDIIRLSELDNGTQEEVFERVNLYALAQTCVDMLQISAEKHKVNLELRGTDNFVNGNKQMLEELLYNLCENAIRYNNENGSVTVMVMNHKEKTLLVVEDTGIGIPKESQDRVFERFFCVDKSRSKSTGGTGLGLAIVKHIVMKHEAEISLESEIGKGTKITVAFH